MSYLTLTDFFAKDIIEKPLHIDCLLIEKDGIKIKVYGVLHALTSGTNREYVNFVNDTIQKDKQKNIKILSEKSMKKMYKGIDQEVEDWLQVPFKDVFMLSHKLLLPHNLLKLVYMLIKEKVQKNDRFSMEVKRLQDIGGSKYFHKLYPTERRIIAGFPSSNEYFKTNLKRLQNQKTWSAPVFPDKDWSWLTVIEPYTNIPMRSVHMLEYALQYAKKHNLNEIALVVGETHNSDISWYANEFDSSLLNNDKEKKIFNKVLERTQYPFKNKWKMLFNKVKYFTGSLLGALSILMLYGYFLLLIN